MRDELLLYFARLKVEAYSVEVDLDFVSWELQIDHCFCSAVKKKKKAENCSRCTRYTQRDVELKEAGDCELDLSQADLSVSPGYTVWDRTSARAGTPISVSSSIKLVQ